MNPFGWLGKLFHIRTLVLLSLLVQLGLSLLGRRRKSVRGIWIRIIVWFTFLLADSLAIYSLGKLSDAASKYNYTCEDNEGIPNKELMMLWAPLLLLHLGGPDTITAYSIEDVHLWTRRVFLVILNVAIVIYVLLQSWSEASFWISMLTAPLFIAGFVKYAERSWVLWRSSKVFPQPQLPIRFTDEDEVLTKIGEEADHYLDERMVPLSYLTLQALAPCFLGLEEGDPLLISTQIFKIIWPSKDAIDSVRKVRKNNVKLSLELEQVETCFKFLEIQLGFLFDLLYTKANTIYTKSGSIVRILCLFLVLVALVGFQFIAKDGYSYMDLYVTNALLGGAVTLEFIGLVLVLWSDLGIVWMTKHREKPLVGCILRCFAPIIFRGEERCASSLPQLNLIDLVSYEEKPANLLHKILKSFGKDEDFKVYCCRKDVIDVGELKDSTNNRVKKYFFAIFNKFKVFGHKKDVGDLKGIKKLLMKDVKDLLLNHFKDWRDWHKCYHERGTHTLNRHKVVDEKIHWSISQGFNRSILLWHIATNCCYYKDTNQLSEEEESSRKASKLISDYMMYLLVKCPGMLGNNNATAAKACDLGALLNCYAQFTKGIEKKEQSDYEAMVCSKLLDDHVHPKTCTRNDSKSANPALSVDYARVPIDARELANALLAEKYGNCKWQIIRGVWAEMLFHGATICPFVDHLQQLRRGGEFISQVWLLLFIHGLAEPSPRDFLRPIFIDAFETRGEP